MICPLMFLGCLVGLFCRGAVCSVYYVFQALIDFALIIPLLVAIGFQKAYVPPGFEDPCGGAIPQAGTNSTVGHDVQHFFDLLSPGTNNSATDSCNNVVREWRSEIATVLVIAGDSNVRY